MALIDEDIKKLFFEKGGVMLKAFGQKTVEM